MKQGRVSFTVMVAIAMLLTGALASAPAHANGADQRPVLNPLQQAFTTPTPSIARADLLACQELSRATARNPGNLRVEDLADMLSGTWVRHLTWNGVPIETDSALYFDLQGERPTALMYDRSNMGGGPMADRLEQLKRSPAQLAVTPTLTFVDCDFLIRDEYYKVSDEFLFDGLPVEVSETSEAPLPAVWKQLVAQDYFDKANAAVDTGPVTEDSLVENPGLELTLPAVVGAHWQVNLTPIKMSGYNGVQINLDGEYRGTHVGFEIGEAAHGVETAKFFMEGERFVSSVLPGGRIPGPTFASNELAAESTEISGGWETECDDVLELSEEINWERVVVSPGGASRDFDSTPKHASRPAPAETPARSAIGGGANEE